jgi:hypothetical protein
MVLDGSPSCRNLKLASAARGDGMEIVRARLEWRGGMYEDFSSLEEAKRMVRRVFPRTASLPWETTEDGNYRQLNFHNPVTRARLWPAYSSH